MIRLDRIDAVATAGLLACLTTLAAGVQAQTEIHRCIQEDGSVAFQEMPCAERGSDGDDSDLAIVDDSPPADAEDEFVNPFDSEDGVFPAQQAPDPELTSAERAACVQETRDAIDAIDAEMREGYTKEEGDEYLAELLELTRQLRACKGS